MNDACQNPCQDFPKSIGPGICLGQIVVRSGSPQNSVNTAVLELMRVIPKACGYKRGAIVTYYAFRKRMCNKCFKKAYVRA
jgi:hypothetical protein